MVRQKRCYPFLLRVRQVDLRFPNLHRTWRCRCRSLIREELARLSYEEGMKKPPSNRSGVLRLVNWNPVKSPPT